MQDIRASLERVRERIARAAARAGRRAEDVLLIAVSKAVEPVRIREAVAAGVPALGENRVQEARAKIAELGRAVPWHLVGQLQTNKAKDAVELFDLIHSVDRPELARELDKRARQRGRPVEALVQVNVAGEASKGGVARKGKTIGFVGAGNTGEAMIKGLRAANLVPPEAVYAPDVRPERLKEIDRQYSVRIAADNPELVRHVDVVIMAVKPQIIEPVLKEIAHALTRQKLLISIAAGVTTEKLRTVLRKDARPIRLMPNTPALVLAGVTAIAKAEGLEPGDLDTAREIFSAVGRVVVLEEGLLDAVTGLSGSGPAYVALVIESLADGGVKMGLDRITAMTLATQTVLGAAKLLLETGLHPGALKDMVSSPGGTSIAGIAALEEGGIRTTFIKAVERATQRSRELGRGTAG